MGVREAAAEYRRRGFAILRMRGDEKKQPVCSGWRKRSHEPDEFVEGESMAVQTGAPSGGLVCIDLDDDRALALADEHLPPTNMTEGRVGRPRSHRWYRMTDVPEWAVSPLPDGGPRSRSLKRDNKEILGFKGTGVYAVVPPSGHGSGEQRVWQPGGEPASVPFPTLWGAVLRIAVACGYVEQPRDRGEKAASKPKPPALNLPTFDPPADLPRGDAERARAYIAAIRSVSGKGGDNALWRAARVLVNDAALPRAEALQLLAEWNRTNASPPWDRGTLERKLDEAVAAGERDGHPRGRLQAAEKDDRPFNDPQRLAAEFPGVWRYWHDGLYRYDDDRYVLVPDCEVRALLRDHAEAVFKRVYQASLGKYQRELKAREEMEAKGAKFPKALKKPVSPQVSAPLVRECLEALQSDSLVSGKLNMPCLLPGGSEPHLLSFANGLLDVESGALRPHTPDWFSAAHIPYAYDPTASHCPKLLGALAAWFGGGDTERVALAQEWVGYLLTRSTDAQSYMMLVGEGGNGKGAFTAAIEALLGPDNVSHLPWEALGGRFQLATTLGKLLNVSDDIGEFDRSAEGTLKWFVGGKPVTFERKGKDPFSATPTARLMLACNQPPRVSDKTEGVWRRMLLLPFDGAIPEGARVRGMDKAKWWMENADMAGVLNWALAGLARLRANGWAFTRPARSEEARQELRREFNPAMDFLGEHTVADPEAKGVSSRELYRTYREWCANGGYSPLNTVNFAKEVKRQFPEAKSRDRKVKQEGLGGKAAYVVAKYWHGLRFLTPRDAAPANWGVVAGSPGEGGASATGG